MYLNAPHIQEKELIETDKSGSSVLLIWGKVVITKQFK